MSAIRQQRNCTDDENYITCNGNAFNPCTDIFDESCPVREAYHKKVVEEIISEISKTEKAPRYEPFANRTPLVCENVERPVGFYYEKFFNGVGNICNPCGVPCKGTVFKALSLISC